MTLTGYSHILCDNKRVKNIYQESFSDTRKVILPPVPFTLEHKDKYLKF